MSTKKISTILNLIEIAETNLKTAKGLLNQLVGEKGGIATTNEIARPVPVSTDEENALEVVEGYFDGENMLGDNGQTYIVPPNYASKTGLVVGDRMKWMLTSEREIFKLISPANRERVTGTFTIEGDSYLVLVDKLPNPVQILKASATYAMKNLGLKVGDDVSITVPKDTTPTWGAFNSVIKGGIKQELHTQQDVPISDPLDEFKLDSMDLNSNTNFF